MMHHYNVRALFKRISFDIAGTFKISRGEIDTFSVMD
jgi:hypothetical protein